MTLSTRLLAASISKPTPAAPGIPKQFHLKVDALHALGHFKGSPPYDWQIFEGDFSDQGLLVRDFFVAPQLCFDGMHGCLFCGRQLIITDMNRSENA